MCIISTIDVNEIEKDDSNEKAKNPPPNIIIMMRRCRLVDDTHGHMHKQSTQRWVGRVTSRCMGFESNVNVHLFNLISFVYCCILIFVPFNLNRLAVSRLLSSPFLGLYAFEAQLIWLRLEVKISLVSRVSKMCMESSIDSIHQWRSIYSVVCVM